MKNWSTIVQNILDDEEVFSLIFKGKKIPSWVSGLNKKNGANAIVVAMIIKAIQGDKHAAEWLRKTGFGDKVVHEFENSLFNTEKLTIEVVENVREDNAEQEATTGPADDKQPSSN